MVEKNAFFSFHNVILPGRHKAKPMLQDRSGYRGSDLGCMSILPEKARDGEWGSKALFYNYLRTESSCNLKHLAVPPTGLAEPYRALRLSRQSPQQRHPSQNPG